MRNVKGIVVTLAPPAPDVTVVGESGMAPKILVDKATLQVIVGRRRLAAMRAAGIPITEDMIERVLHPRPALGLVRLDAAPWVCRINAALRRTS